MTRIFYTFIWYLFSLQLTFADGWVLWNFRWDETEKALRNWYIRLEDIPNMIQSAINFFMWIAWTVAIIFIIIWAYKILFGSLESDKSKWKETIIMALSWFAIASLAWFIIKLIIDNLGKAI